MCVLRVFYDLKITITKLVAVTKWRSKGKGNEVTIN